MAIKCDLTLVINLTPPKKFSHPMNFATVQNTGNEHICRKINGNSTNSPKKLTALSMIYREIHLPATSKHESYGTKLIFKNCHMTSPKYTLVRRCHSLFSDPVQKE